MYLFHLFIVFRIVRNFGIQAKRGEPQIETRWLLLLNVAWAEAREAGSLKAQTPSWFLLVINTEKARWLISRALALGFYPDVGGGVYKGAIHL